MPNKNDRIHIVKERPISQVTMAHEIQVREAIEEYLQLRPSQYTLHIGLKSWTFIFHFPLTRREIHQAIRIEDDRLTFNRAITTPHSTIMVMDYYIFTEPELKIRELLLEALCPDKENEIFWLEEMVYNIEESRGYLKIGCKVSDFTESYVWSKIAPALQDYVELNYSTFRTEKPFLVSQIRVYHLDLGSSVKSFERW